MPSSRRVSRWPSTLTIAAFALQAGCASSPERLYTLELPPSEEAREAQRSALPQTVVLGTVTVPLLVDRPQIVLRDGPYGIKIGEQDRWATPLKNQLSRVLAAQLSALRPDVRFVTADSAAINAPIGRLSVDFGHLDLGPNREVHMTVHWVYRPANTDLRVVEGESRADARVNGGAYLDYVDALLRANQLLATALVSQLPYAAGAENKPSR